MLVPHVVLGLLEPAPTHGYTLKAAYDERFGRERPLRYGQVYATLARLQREGLAAEVAIEAGAGPDRRLFAITPAGVEQLESWLTTPEPPQAYATSALFAKTMLALSSGRNPADVLDAQRAAHLARMRDVTALARGAEPTMRLSADFELAHLEADLRWIELAGERLAQQASS
jgi:DNA-binding PadR family transcriptional regulator